MGLRCGNDRQPAPRRCDKKKQAQDKGGGAAGRVLDVDGVVNTSSQTHQLCNDRKPEQRRAVRGPFSGRGVRLAPLFIE